MEKTAKFEITEEDLASIPDYTRRFIARNALRSIRAFVTAPGGREFLDAKVEQMKAENHPIMQILAEQKKQDVEVPSEG